MASLKDLAPGKHKITSILKTELNFKKLSELNEE